MTTYRSEVDFDEQVRPCASPTGRSQSSATSTYQGRKLVERFDADTYRVLARAIDDHDIGRDRGGVRAALEALARAGTRLTGVGIEGDILYGPAQVGARRRRVGGRRRCPVPRRPIDQGHDAFLVEWDQLAELLRVGRGSRRTRRSLTARPDSRRSAPGRLKSGARPCPERGSRARARCGVPLPVAGPVQRAGHQPPPRPRRDAAATVRLRRAPRSAIRPNLPNARARLSEPRPDRHRADLRPRDRLGPQRRLGGRLPPGDSGRDARARPAAAHSRPVLPARAADCSTGPAPAARTRRSRAARRPYARADRFTTCCNLSPLEPTGPGAPSPRSASSCARGWAGHARHRRRRRRTSPGLPTGREQVAEDVDPGVGQCTRDARHAARTVVHLGEDRLALDKRVVTFLENQARRLVVRGGHDHVATVPDPTAADGTEIDAAPRQVSASVAIAPGSFFSWTTNWLGIEPLGVRAGFDDLGMTARGPAAGEAGQDPLTSSGERLTTSLTLPAVWRSPRRGCHGGVGILRAAARASNCRRSA